MTPKIILLDLDGPVANFEQGFLELWQKQFPKEPFIPLKDRITHSHTGQYPEKMVLKIYGTPGFFRNLKPVHGFKEAVQELEHMGHDVRICTSPLSEYRHCVLEKYEWVDEHLGKAAIDKMILTRDKTIVAGHILIDDNPEITGTMLPKWARVVFDMPFNRTVARAYPRMNWRTWKRTLLPILSVS